MSAQPTPPLDLERLDLLLAREGMARSPDVWFYLHQLLLRRTAGGRLETTPDVLANLIGPLVCKNPQQQARLPAVCREWLHAQNPVIQAAVAVPAQTVDAEWRKRRQRFYCRSLLALIAMLVLLTTVALALIYRPQTPDVRLPPPIAELPAKPQPALDAAAQKIPISDRIAPNPLPPPEGIPVNWQRLQRLLDAIVPGLPALAAILYLIWRYRSRMVLRNRTESGEKRLTGLKFASADDDNLAPFSGPELADTSGRLLRPLWLDSRRLDVEQSAVATALNAGFFTPRYRQRHVYPEYLVLVQSVHGNDQAAAFAELLVDALKQQKVPIRSYRFRADPRRLIPWLQPPEGADRAALSLMELAQKRGDARLIVISDWEILFEPYYPDRPQPWVKDFERWTRRVWLSPGYAGEGAAKRAEAQSQTLNFRLLPLASQTLPELVHWLLQEERPAVPQGETRDDYLPPQLGESAEAWLDWRPPHGADVKRLLKELQAYLGKDGYLLLQALAVFPKPLWPLPDVLDVQLFADQPDRRSRFRRWQGRRRAQAQAAAPAVLDRDRDRARRAAREMRLSRLSRLPWSRHAYLPDYLRLRLLKTLSGAERRRIRTAWAGLLDRLSRGENPETLNLPIALPKIDTLRLQKLIAAEPPHSALNDPIFANILLGGKLGLLDFRLPGALARLLPGAGKRLDVRPAFAAAALAAVGVYGMQYAWQTQARQPLLDVWQRQIDRENAGWQVGIGYRPETQDLAAVLAQSLATDAFQTRQTPAPPGAAAAHNRIGYPPGGRAVAERVAERLAWHSYGAAVDLVASPALAANILSVQLQVTYQPQAVFHDTLRNAYLPAAKPANPSVLPLEPDMVVLKPGSFLMGSPANEANRFDNEGPPHKVTISRPFALGKYEVTFAEYDRFAEATGRQLPDDNDWGRGNRPVIRVSFDDAKAYAVWLSQRTGKNYRLPSEAEWEYAVRAGTTAAFYWGDAGKPDNYAWYSANSGGKTQPVGRRKPNAFGLFDMAGNAWEWTEDCWHDSYYSAPDNGAAWLADNGGDCGLRVVRGGSWLDFPLHLRSAYRDRGNTALYLLGFRLARAL